MKRGCCLAFLLGSLAALAGNPGDPESPDVETPVTAPGSETATGTALPPEKEAKAPDKVLTAPVPTGTGHPAALPATAPGWRHPSWHHAPFGGHFSFGTRRLQLNLKRYRQGEPFDGSFIGSINKLEAVEDRRLNRPFIQYAIMPYFGIGVQQDRLEIKTVTTIPRAQRADDRDTDGNVIMRGVLPYVFARLPNRTLCTPFIEVGEARYRNRFDPDPRWYAGGRRQFILDPVSKASYRAAGLEFALGRHVALDLYYRSMDIDVPGEYHFRPDGRPPESFVFTMKHNSYGFGARVLF